jgi:hypothetical protein
MQSSRRSPHSKPERSSRAEGYGLTFGNQSITAPRTGTLIAGDLLYNGAFALPGEHRPAQHDAWLERLDYLESRRPKRLVAGHSKLVFPTTTRRATGHAAQPRPDEVREVDRVGGIAAKRIIMIDQIWPTLSRAARALVACFAFVGSQLGAQSPAFAGSRFDRQWNLVFVTQRGDCDPSYSFTVDVANGNISHPNILTFKGHVASSGAVRASVRVGQKYASGSGRICGGVGRGAWSGRSGQSRCAGTWTAQRN